VDRYNHFVQKLFVAPLVAVMLLAGCAKDIQTTDAVRQAIFEYLQARSADMGIDMNNIDVKVTSVSFEQDVARASVAFVPKNGPEGAGMSMNYVLDRKGTKWAVRGRQSDPANPHGGGQALPGTPALPGGGQLPPGHPSTGDAPSGQLPPGHPSPGTKQ
jgi:hypothetical protein